MVQLNSLSILFLAVFLLQTAAYVALELLNHHNIRNKGDQPPKIFADRISESKLKHIREYSLERSAFAVVKKLVVDVVLLGIIVLGAWRLFDIKPEWGYVWGGLVFFSALGAFFFVIDLPFDYYSTFVLEEKHGFNKSALSTWAMDQLKGLALAGVILAAILVPVLWTIDSFPQGWWFWGFLIVSAVRFGLMILYPTIIAPIFNRFEPLRDRDLAHRVEDLVRRVGMNPDGVFQMDAGRRSGHSNAYFTGIGNTKRIVLFDTLLEAHAGDEIISVLAHELGHFKLGHIMRSYLLGLAGTLSGFVLIWLAMSSSALAFTFGVVGAHSYTALFIAGVFLQKLAYFAVPLLSALSRRHEWEADAFAADLAPATPLASALEKLALDNLSSLHPHPVYAWYYYSHPPIVQRISALREKYEGKNT